MSEITRALAQSAIPVARAYIRFSPFAVGKRNLWSHFYWRKKSYTVKTVHGFRMSGCSSDVVQGYIYYFGFWEPNLTKFVKNHVTGNDRIVVDIGANVGYFSLLSAQLLPEGRVIAVEPLPSIYSLLSHNISINGYAHIDAVNCAVSDCEETLLMYRSPLNEGAATSNDEVVRLYPDRFDDDAISVPAKPLDAILRDYDIGRIKLIKIDVEGAEWKVLKGVYPILSRLPQDAVIVIELSPELMTESQLSEIFRRFEDQGFSAWSLENSYALEAYLDFRSAEPPCALTDLPRLCMDVVFSRQALT